MLPIDFFKGLLTGQSGGSSQQGVENVKSSRCNKTIDSLLTKKAYRGLYYTPLGALIGALLGAAGYGLKGGKRTQRELLADLAYGGIFGTMSGLGLGMLTDAAFNVLSNE